MVVQSVQVRCPGGKEMPAIEIEDGDRYVSLSKHAQSAPKSSEPDFGAKEIDAGSSAAAAADSV